MKQHLELQIFQTAMPIQCTLSNFPSTVLKSQQKVMPLLAWNLFGNRSSCGPCWRDI